MNQALLSLFCSIFLSITLSLPSPLSLFPSFTVVFFCTHRFLTSCCWWVSWLRKVTMETAQRLHCYHMMRKLIKCDHFHVLLFIVSSFSSFFLSSGHWVSSSSWEVQRSVVRNRHTLRLPACRKGLGQDGWYTYTGCYMTGLVMWPMMSSVMWPMISSICLLQQNRTLISPIHFPCCLSCYCVLVIKH